MNSSTSATRIRGRPISNARLALGRIFFQRCFYLFVILLAFDVIAAFIDPTPQGRLVALAVNSLVVVSCVAAVGRTVFSFVVVCFLAGMTLLFFVQNQISGEQIYLVRAYVFSAALDLATVVYLLQYVFRPEVMTADKLFGAAAAYLLLASLWATLYVLTNHYYPGSFSAGTEGQEAEMSDYLYFSYTVLTSTGFGDIVPKTHQARAVCMVEQITGAMYVAILIARLAGVYPPTNKGGASTQS